MKESQLRKGIRKIIIQEASEFQGVLDKHLETPNYKKTVNRFNKFLYSWISNTVDSKDVKKMQNAIFQSFMEFDSKDVESLLKTLLIAFKGVKKHSDEIEKRKAQSFDSGQVVADEMRKKVYKVIRGGRRNSKLVHVDDGTTRGIFVKKIYLSPYNSSDHSGYDKVYEKKVEPDLKNL